MKELILGRTNYSLSKLGLGTVQFGLDYGFTKKKSQDQVDKILSCALNNRVNFLDTARDYGDSEEKIGKFISENNNDFIVATKLTKIQYDSSFKYNRLKKRIFNSVERSLTCLKLDKIDILQLHQTDDYLINNKYFWEIINQLKNENLIGAFGISVYDEMETKCIVEHYFNLIDFFQVPYNLFDTRFDVLRRLFSRYSIGVISRSTFLKGIIPCPIERLPKELVALTSYKIKLNNLAQDLSLKAEELAILFVYWNEFITSTILGVDSPEELESNVDIVNSNIHITDSHYLKGLSVSDRSLIDPRKWTNF